MNTKHLNCLQIFVVYEWRFLIRYANSRRHLQQTTESIIADEKQASVYGYRILEVKKVLIIILNCSACTKVWCIVKERRFFCNAKLSPCMERPRQICPGHRALPQVKEHGPRALRALLAQTYHFIPLSMVWFWRKNCRHTCFLAICARLSCASLH